MFEIKLNLQIYAFIVDIGDHDYKFQIHEFDKNDKLYHQERSISMWPTNEVKCMTNTQIITHVESKSIEIESELSEYIYKLGIALSKNNLSILYDFIKEFGIKSCVRWDIINKFEIIYYNRLGHIIGFTIDYESIRTFPNRLQLDTFVKLVEKYYGMCKCELPVDLTTFEIFTGKKYDHNLMDIDNIIYNRSDKKKLYEYLGEIIDEVDVIKEMKGKTWFDILINYCKFKDTSLVKNARK